MNVAFTCVTDVGSGYIAVLVLGFSAQDGFQVHLGSIQLRFSRCFVRSRKVRTAQRFVGQSAYRAVRTVKYNRGAAGFAQRNFVVQTEINFASRQGFGLNVAIGTGVSNGIT